MLPDVGGVVVGFASVTAGANATMVAAKRVKVRIMEDPFYLTHPLPLVPSRRALVHSMERRDARFMTELLLGAWSSLLPSRATLVRS